MHHRQLPAVPQQASSSSIKAKLDAFKQSAAWKNRHAKRTVDLTKPPEVIDLCLEDDEEHHHLNEEHQAPPSVPAPHPPPLHNAPPETRREEESTGLRQDLDPPLAPEEQEEDAVSLQEEESPIQDDDDEPVQHKHDHVEEEEDAFSFSLEEELHESKEDEKVDSLTNSHWKKNRKRPRSPETTTLPTTTTAPSPPSLDPPHASPLATQKSRILEVEYAPSYHSPLRNNADAPVRHALLGNATHHHQTSSSLSNNPNAPVRHALLGNATHQQPTTFSFMPSNNEEDEHYNRYLDPSQSPDTETDGLLSSAEMELAWLCEESCYCFDSEETKESLSFIYKYASSLLRLLMRKNSNVLMAAVRVPVQEAFLQKRSEIRESLRAGHRRPEMKKVIAAHRLLLKKPNADVSKLLQPPTKPANWTDDGFPLAAAAAPRHQRAATALVPTHSNESTVTSSHKPPPSSSSPKSSPKSLAGPTAATTINSPPNHSSKQYLTPYEWEIAWLMEESQLQSVNEGYDFDFMKNNASPTLRELMKACRNRWLPRLVRITNAQVHDEFEKTKLEANDWLYRGYRRPETQHVLPGGYTTSSEYKKTQQEQAAHKEKGNA